MVLLETTPQENRKFGTALDTSFSPPINPQIQRRQIRLLSGSVISGFAEGEPFTAAIAESNTAPPEVKRLHDLTINQVGSGCLIVFFVGPDHKVKALQ